MNKKNRVANTRARTLALLLSVAALALLPVVPAYAQKDDRPPWAQTPQDGRAAAGPAAPAEPVPWSSLSPQQQKLLSRFGSEWSTLPPGRQQALAHGSERWIGMSPDQRDQARERFQRFQALPPDQRRALRNRWQKFQALPPEQQSQVRENFHKFQQLPPERRQMLREQWHNASPAERQQMIQHARAQRQKGESPRAAPPREHPAPRPRH